MATVIDAVREETRRDTTKAARRVNRGQLRVQRDGISFHCPRPGVVRIEVAIHNVGMETSLPTAVRLESAVLGAFVPWKPLTSLTVPSLAPGTTTVVGTEVPRPQAEPLGDFDRLPPRRLLTALDLDDSDESSGPRSLASLLTGKRKRRPRSGGGLASDLFELMGRATVHWAGNLNVFIGSQRVERHAVQALRVYPGRTNLAMFCVGCGRDAYAFDIKGADPSWQCTLYDTKCFRRPLAECIGSDLRVGPSEWIETWDMAIMVLAIVPPEDCREGRVEVHVGQRSTGASAVVEFSMDAAAKGPGCYVV